ncbi:MAG: magnesium transporter CorA family protein [Eggerthellaceae bacterium]
MIEYFIMDEKNNSLVKISHEQPGCWIALFEPTPEELKETATRFRIDEDDIAAPLDPEEISRIENNDDDYVMFIVDTPLHDKSSGEKRYKTIPIGIFQTKDHVISVCSVYRVPLIRILKSRPNELHDTTNTYKFVSDLLIASAQAYFASLQALDKRRRILTAAIEKPSRRELEELYALNDSLVYIQTSLATNNTVFERYRRHIQASGNAEVIELYDDVIVEHQQALETAKIYSAILDSAIDHFGLIMDYDLNHTMQLVATLTLVLCVPTVIGGLFGMNLGGIPLTESPYGFSLVTGITAIVLIVLLIILKRLKWF